MSFVHLEMDSLNISKICQRANTLLASLSNDELSDDQLHDLVEEMLRFDDEAVQWRQKPEWSFRTVRKTELKGDKDLISRLPETVELHADIWMAYEWNYHRTARIILHQKLLACIQQALSMTPFGSKKQLLSWEQSSLSITCTLAEQVLASVPQSMGDVNALGHCLPANATQVQAVGAYFLLWPIKIIKGPQSMATQSQRDTAAEVFERIRSYTGMRSTLGTLSMI